MSSTFNDHRPKREPNDNHGNGVGIVYPPSSPSSLLKLNKSSHVIKKPPSPSSSTSATATKPRQPVIIYTNTPKVIHTNPKDFMSLVQKLTGMSRSDEDFGGIATTDHGGKSDLTVGRKNTRLPCSEVHPPFPKFYSGAGASNGKGIYFNNATICEDSESSSVITTDENIGEHGQVNSAVAIPPPPPPPPSASSMYDTAGFNYGYLSAFSNLPGTNPADNYLQYANFEDPLYFAPNMRNSFSSSSSSGFDGLSEFRDF
ncbi:unnamed protein product [Cochlearia groenlandica]